MLLRWTRLMFSERYKPWMAPVAALAESIRQTRVPLPDDNPAIRSERASLAQTGETIAAFRKARDAAIGAFFTAIYGRWPLSPLLQPKE